VKLKYPGVPVYINGQNFYIPSLSTRDFREHYAEISKEDEENPAESFDRLIPIIGLAVRRNYPDVSDEQLAEWLDLYTFRQAVKAMANASGMEPVTEGD
jgi:hypothetical protein